jgi:uncharacterized protein
VSSELPPPPSSGAWGETLPPVAEPLPAPLPPPPATPAATFAEERPTATWSWWEALALFVIGNFVIGGIVVAGVVLVVLGDTPSTTGGLDLPGIVASIAADLTFIAVMVAYLQWRHPGWVRAVGFSERGRRLGDTVWGAIAGLLLYPAVSLGVGIFVTILFRAMFPGEDVKAPEQLSDDLSAAGRVLATILAVGIAPFTEELFFRGLLYRSLRDRHGVRVAIVVSSLLFGLVHVTLAPWRDVVLLQAVMVFTGVGLAWVYERRGLFASVAAHTVFNIIGVVLIFAWS